MCRRHDKFEPLWKALCIPCNLTKSALALDYGEYNISCMVNAKTYLQVLHHLPFSSRYFSCAILNLTVTLSDMIVRRSRVESFFTVFSSSSAPHWWLVRSSSWDSVSLSTFCR